MGGFWGRPSGPQTPFFYEISVILPSSLSQKKKKNRKYTRRKVNMGAKTLGDHESYKELWGKITSVK